MNDLRAAAQQALEALQWHYRQGHSNTLGGFRLKIDEKALRELSAALAQQDEPVQDQRCRAEPRSDGDFVCDCKIGECPGRSAALAQQAEPLNLRDPAVQKRLATQWGYVPAAQAEPVEPVDVGLLEYRGNSVAFIHQKMTAYRSGIDAAWDAFRAKGLHPDGKTPLANMIAKYTAPPQRTMVPLTEKEMYAVEEEARKNFRLSQKGPRGQQITYWDGLTPWLIRAVERAHGIKE